VLVARPGHRTLAPIEPHKLQHYRRSLELLRISGIRTAHVDELARRLEARRSFRPPYAAPALPV
jgi:hypothetical protein